MNERILSPQLLKLVQEAGPGYSLADPKWVKKFAELIVRECANIDFRRELGLSNNQDCEVSQLIKNHFGVKE